MQKLSPVQSLFQGFQYFLTRPKLWILPLLTTLITFVFFLAIFVSIVWRLWPKESLSFIAFSFALFKALGLGFFVLLLLWAFIFPIILNFSFEHLQRDVLQEGERASFFHSMQLGIAFTLKTLAPRILWPLITVLSIFIIPFATPVLAQLALGHIAVLDALALGAGILGLSLERLMKEISTKRKGVWLASLTAGAGSFFLTPTLIGWMFWIPSIYIGVAMLLKSWMQSNSEKKS